MIDRLTDRLKTATVGHVYQRATRHIYQEYCSNGTFTEE